MKEILLNVEPKEIRVAKLKHGKLTDLHYERKSSRQLTGNIYKGVVTNILENIQSAFIDIGTGENGFIHISDIIENTKKFQEMFDMDFEWNNTSEKASKDQEKTSITELLKPGQTVLVQVVKEPIGTKGARLTSNISFAGRYLVMLPNSSHRGVSKKIQDQNSRDRLKKTIQAFEMPNDVGLICRTASMTATQEQLVDEAESLINEWLTIRNDFKAAKDATCIYEDSTLEKKALITAIDKNYSRILIDDQHTYQMVSLLSKKYPESASLKIEYYRDSLPMFERFGVEREIDKALRRKIWLPSGGYLYFDRTEAMYTVDVNSGRSSKKTSSVEETIVKINCEAAEEIARQLRLRNIGGLIICDFIDMQSRKNQRRVLDTFKESLKEDSTKCSVLSMSEFGLVEMTRQRTRESLAQTLFTQCPYCNGSGTIKNHETTSIDIERTLKSLVLKEEFPLLVLYIHPHLNNYISRDDKDYLESLSGGFNTKLHFKTSDALHLNQFEFHSDTHGSKINF